MTILNFCAIDMPRQMLVNIIIQKIGDMIPKELVMMRGAGHGDGESEGRKSSEKVVLSIRGTPMAPGKRAATRPSP